MAKRMILLLLFLLLTNCNEREQAQLQNRVDTFVDPEKTAIADVMKQISLVADRMDGKTQDEKRRQFSQLIDFLETLDVSKCPADFKFDYTSLLSALREGRSLANTRNSAIGSFLVSDEEMDKMGKRIGHAFERLEETSKKYGVTP